MSNYTTSDTEPDDTDATFYAVSIGTDIIASGTDQAQVLTDALNILIPPEQFR